jgi:hypothetical protein
MCDRETYGKEKSTMNVFCVLELLPGQPEDDVPLKLRVIFKDLDAAQAWVDTSADSQRYLIETWYVLGE